MTATYSPATIRRCNTILARAAKAEVSARKAPKADWRKRPASDSQLRRINALEKSLDYRLSTKRTIGNAGAASDLYHSLKAEIA